MHDQGLVAYTTGNPMPIMTKLPADSFWPTGTRDSDMHIPFPNLTKDSSSSVISPLALPRGAHGYFDHVVSNGNTPTHLHPVSQPRGSQTYSPLSPHVLPFAKQGQFQYDQNRSSSLPPTIRSGFTSPRPPGNGANRNQDMAVGLTNGMLSPPGNGPAYSRSVSADEVASSTHDCMVRRLLQQKARMQEAWEAERKYLEANRERAEEVYKEERALMEEERAEWEAEKAALLGEIERLGGTNPLAMNGLPFWARTPFASLGHREGSQGTSRISPDSSLSSERSSQPVGQNGRPAAQNGSSQLPIPGPRAQDLASPRSPNGPSAATADFMKQDEAPDTATEPIPIVDVQEIHPELEGIPIKATNVKKATFKDTGSQDGSNSSSPSGSPPSGSDQTKSPRVKKEQTLQVLAAKEADRLTMHAGHTPSHSLSSVGTVVSSGTATATSNSGDSTPTMPHDDVAFSQGTTTGGGGSGVYGSQQVMAPFPSIADQHGYLLVDHPEPVFEPTEDRELKGPLMVRNMPAHDEIFFQKLSDKLEEVSKDNAAALPAVLKDSGPAQPATAEVKTQAEDQPGAGSEAGSEDTSKSSPKSSDEDELDVPLKFKKRMNFGAPFGEFR